MVLFRKIYFSGQWDKMEKGLTMVICEHLQKFLVVFVDVFCSFRAVTDCCIVIHRIKIKSQRQVIK